MVCGPWLATQSPVREKLSPQILCSPVLEPGPAPMSKPVLLGQCLFGFCGQPLAH